MQSDSKLTVTLSVDSNSKLSGDLRQHKASSEHIGISYSSLKCVIFDFEAALRYLPFNDHFDRIEDLLQMMGKGTESID